MKKKKISAKLKKMLSDKRLTGRKVIRGRDGPPILKRMLDGGRSAY
jgi:hypothetical protein